VIRASFAVALCAGSACTRETWRNADLQVDVRAPLPALAEQVRLCVADGPARTLGAGPDRYALPGLRAQEPATLTADLLARASEDTASGPAVVLARVEGVTLTADRPYQEADLSIFVETADGLLSCDACPPACEPEGPSAGAQEETWLLTVRFQS
jgi:hypothetical protein